MLPPANLPPLPGAAAQNRPRYALLLFCLVGLGSIVAASPSGCEGRPCCSDCDSTGPHDHDGDVSCR